MSSPNWLDNKRLTQQDAQTERTPSNLRKVLDERNSRRRRGLPDREITDLKQHVDNVLTAGTPEAIRTEASALAWENWKYLKKYCTLRALGKMKEAEALYDNTFPHFDD